MEINDAMVLVLTALTMLLAQTILRFMLLYYLMIQAAFVFY